VPLGEVVQILATGFGDDEESAAGAARAKHLLETVLGRACLVRPVAARLRLVGKRRATS
jgi:hypothetical protein